MISFDDLEKLKREVAALQREHDRAEGTYRELMRRLKAEFKVKTLKEAKALLHEKEALERKAAIRYRKKKAAFERRYAERLRSLRDEPQDRI